MYKSLLSIAILIAYAENSLASENLFDVHLNEVNDKLLVASQELKYGTYKLSSNNNPLGFKTYIFDITPTSKKTYQIIASKKSVDCIDEIIKIIPNIKYYYGDDLEILKKNDSIMYQNNDYIVKTYCQKKFLKFRVVSKPAAKLFIDEVKIVKNKNPDLYKIDKKIGVPPVLRTDFSSDFGSFGILFTDTVDNIKFKYEKDNMYKFEPDKKNGMFISYYVEKNKYNNQISKIIGGVVIKDAIRDLGITPTQFCMYEMSRRHKEIVNDMGNPLDEIYFNGFNIMTYKNSKISMVCKDGKMAFVHEKIN